MRPDFEAVTQRLIPVAVKAILAEEKAKRIATVNHRDNFALYYHRIAESAMLDDVIKVIDGPRGKQRDIAIDWLNSACSVLPSRWSSQIEATAREAAGKAWDQLTGKEKA